MSTTKMYTIVVAAGSSTRFGSNKLDQLIGHERVLARTIRIAKESSDGVIVVVSDPSKYDCDAVDAVVVGGEKRSDSVKNGLALVPSDVEIIAVQDGARPGATKGMYERGRQLIIDGNAGAIPAINVIDTIKKIDENDQGVSTVDRSKLRAVQTPQIFNASTLRTAYEQNVDDTDDAALVEAMGEQIVLFEGSESNRKITTPTDLIIMNALLVPNQNLISKIGSGYDIHPFSNDENKKLVLGGIKIDHRGLDGHSDADAVFHCVTDALLSAIGAPDLGTLFPANNDKYKGASSDVFLSESVRLADNDSFKLRSVSIVINAQEPKLSPYIDDMKKSISEVLALICDEQTTISITPKHGEGVGDIGQGQAIAVYCTVLLSSNDN